MSELAATPDQPKTPEELKQEKIDKFNADPDKFICVDDVIIAAIKDPKGIGILMGGHQRQMIEIALTRLTFKVFSMFLEVDFTQAMQKENKIIHPGGNGKPGGIMNYVRNNK